MGIREISIAILFALSYASLAQITNNGVALTIESGLTMTVEGDFSHETNFLNWPTIVSATIDNDGTIDLKGSWNNNTWGDPVFINTNGIGEVQFTGTDIQYIGLSGITDFENLTINNSSASGIQLDILINVLTHLELTDGIVNGTFSNVVIIADGATSSPGSPDSFVDGPVRKIGNDKFVFPIGDGTVWARLAIDNTASSNNNTEFTAEYWHEPFFDQSFDGSLTGVSSEEYWTVSRVLNDDDVPITLYWEDATRSDIEPGPSLVVARYDGTDWTSEGQSDIDNGDPGNVTSDVVTDFTNLTFTFGTRDAPLPVELLFLTASVQSTGILVEWATITEVNNDFFTVERSPDGFHWEEIAQVPGAGNSSSRIDYSINDQTSFSGNLTYYRLKQTDFDGTFSFSEIVALQDPFGQTSLVKVYPNPTSDVLFLKTDLPLVENIRIVNTSGQDVTDLILSSYDEHLRRWKVDVSALPYGVYAIRMQNATWRFIKN